MTVKPNEEYPEYMRGTHPGRHPWFATHQQQPMDPLPPECKVNHSSLDDRGDDTED